MRIRVFLPFLLIAGLTGAGLAEAKRVRSDEWRRLPSGVEFRVAELPLEDFPITVSMVRFDPTRQRLRVVSEQPEGLRASEAGESGSVAAAVNANLSDGDNCSIGWVVAAAEELGRLRRNLGGTLIVKDDGSTEIWRARYVPHDPPPVEAVQAGDLLVFERFADPSLPPGLSRRSFIGTDPQGRVVIGVTSGPVHGSELARFLAKRESSGGVGLERVLEFGDGPAAQLFVSGADSQGGDLVTPEASAVPVLLVVEPRRR